MRSEGDERSEMNCMVASATLVVKLVGLCGTPSLDGTVRAVMLLPEDSAGTKGTVVVPEGAPSPTVQEPERVRIWPTGLGGAGSSLPPLKYTWWQARTWR